MKIAVCYSGQVRTGVQAFDNHLSLFGDLYQRDQSTSSIDIFVHTWNINSNKRFEHDRTTTEVPQYIFDAWAERLQPKVMVVEDYSNTFKSHTIKYDINYGVRPMFYSWVQAIKMKREWEIKHDFKYDAVVRIRSDILFKPGRSLAQECLKSITDKVFVIENLQPNWHETPFTDDVFWVGTSEMMDRATGYYDYRFHDLNNDSFPSLAQYLHSVGINPVTTMGAGYTIYRKETRHLHPVKDFDQIQQFDWDNFTSTSPLYHAKPDESPDYYS